MKDKHPIEIQGAKFLLSMFWYWGFASLIIIPLHGEIPSQSFPI